MPVQAICPTGVKLETSMKLRLKKLSEQKHRTIHWLMKAAISQYIENEEHEENLKQETLARWEEAEQNKVVNDEQISEWLDTWGTDHETERPSCLN